MHLAYRNADTQHLLRNLIRLGTIASVDVDNGLCRIDTGENTTTWLPWITPRAGRTRVWWAPSIGEQVLLLSLGGEMDTAFVLPGIFSDDFPAPSASASADAVHIAFPDGAVIEYEPLTGALSVIGIKTATINATDNVTVTAPLISCTAATRITLDAPEVVCTQKLVTQTIDIQQGGTLSGDLTHNNGNFSSNGVVFHTHKHKGVQNGGGQTEGPT